MPTTTVELHTRAGPAHVALPDGAVAGRTVARFTHRPVAGGPVLAIAVATDAVAAADDPDGLLRAMAAFWRAGPADLPTLAVGASVPVSGRFLRVDAPWPNPLAGPCPAGAACVPPPPLAAWMLGIRSAGIASPLLAAGEGRLNHELRRSSPGLLAEDVYSIAAGPWRPFLSARLAGTPGLFLRAVPAAETREPVPLARLQAQAAALAALFDSLGPAR